MRVTKYGVSFWGDKMFYNCLQVTAHVCEYTKNTHTKWIASFESANCMACESYLNKIVEK